MLLNNLVWASGCNLSKHTCHIYVEMEDARRGPRCPSKLIVFSLLVAISCSLLGIVVAGHQTTVAVNENVRHSVVIHKPTLLFHFGPRKTGSTTIKAGLSRNATFLEEHFGVAYHMIRTPKKLGQYLVRCFAKKTEQSGCPDELQMAWDNLIGTIESQRRRGVRTFIISWEDVPRFSLANSRILDHLERTFSSTFDCMVTVTYRHFHEWYLSEYNQEQKNRDWKHHRLLGFVDWYRDTEDERKKKEVAPITKTLVEDYQKRFGAVAIFNMNNVSDPSRFVSQWFCQNVPEKCAPMHDWLLLGNQGTKNPSSGVVDARRLAQLVLTRASDSVVPAKKEWARFPSVFSKIQRWLDANFHNATPPLECLNAQEESELWQRTLQTKLELVPEFDVEHDLLRRSFDDAKRKFCQVDYGGLNELPSWKEFVDSKL